MTSQLRPYEVGANSAIAPTGKLQARNLSLPATIALWFACGPFNVPFILALFSLSSGLILVGGVLGADLSSTSTTLTFLGEAIVVLVKALGPDGSNGLGLSGSIIVVLAIHMIVFWVAIPLALRWVKNGACHALAVLAKCLAVGAGAYAVSGFLGGLVFSFGLYSTGRDGISQVGLIMMMLGCSPAVALPGVIYAAILIRLFGVIRKPLDPRRPGWFAQAWRALNAYNGL
ncbi:hypothetical protein [Hyphomonas oceanitis]|uniref:hypothetical protein n=1 Tax=Hyphomonas oceanitis TaxID=81033 RepID=UPI0030031F0F